MREKTNQEIKSMLVGDDRLNPFDVMIDLVICTCDSKVRKVRKVRTNHSSETMIKNNLLCHIRVLTNK